MKKTNKKSTSVANGLFGYSKCRSFEKAKKSLIDMIEEYEAFGLYNAHCLKMVYPHLLSTEVTQPKTIEEFLADLSDCELWDSFFDMVEILCLEGLRDRILKEAGYFFNESYLIRQNSSKNKYPKYYHSEKVKVMGGDQEIEIVFFAKSKKGAELIKKRIRYAVEDGKSLQNHIDEMLETNFNDFLETLMSDPKIQAVADMHSIMTTAYVKAKTQCQQNEKKGK